MLKKCKEEMAKKVQFSINNEINSELVAQHLQQFSWDNAAKKYLEVFENL